MFKNKKQQLYTVMTILFLSVSLGSQNASFYSQSYALVVGINEYPSPTWKNLKQAVNDAVGMARYLNSQGFNVTTLYDKEATRAAIISKMQTGLARQVDKNDRLLIFFSGHGFTEELGGKEWGYIVPYDASNNTASYISMDEIRTLSEKMGNAKHQLFIMDACYGGLLATRGGGVNPDQPKYLEDVTKRGARQMITAGGRGQQAVDGVFTNCLLEALEQGQGDINSDGYITFSELSSYVQYRATNQYQTPATASLPGHALGEFVFKSPKAATQSYAPATSSGGLKGPGGSASETSADEIKEYRVFGQAGKFTKTGNNAWEEVSPAEAENFQFREVGRTVDFITIHDNTRKMSVRLPRYGEWSFYKWDTEPEWKRLYRVRAITEDTPPLNETSRSIVVGVRNAANTTHMFIQESPDSWYEYDNNSSAPNFTFKEVTRDAQKVTIMDQPRRLGLRLPLQGNVIEIQMGDDPAWYPQWDAQLITQSFRLESEQGTFAGCAGNSQAGGQEANLTFYNFSTRELAIFWKDFQGDAQFYINIGPGGKSQGFITGTRQLWCLKDVKTGQEISGVWVNGTEQVVNIY